MLWSHCRPRLHRVCSCLTASRRWRLAQQPVGWAFLQGSACQLPPIPCDWRRGHLAGSCRDWSRRCARADCDGFCLRLPALQGCVCAGSEVILLIARLCKGAEYSQLA